MVRTQIVKRTTAVRFNCFNQLIQVLASRERRPLPDTCICGWDIGQQTNIWTTTASPVDVVKQWMPCPVLAPSCGFCSHWLDFAWAHSHLTAHVIIYVTAAINLCCTSIYKQHGASRLTLVHLENKNTPWRTQSSSIWVIIVTRQAKGSDRAGGK